MMNVQTNRRTEAGPEGPFDEGYITKCEVARRLQKTPRTVEKWQRSGRLPYFKVGNSVLYRWSEVQACMAKFRVVKTADS